MTGHVVYEEARNRVSPRSVRKLGIRALKLMMDKHMFLRKRKIQFFLTHIDYRGQSFT